MTTHIQKAEEGEADNNEKKTTHCSGRGETRLIMNTATRMRDRRAVKTRKQDMRICELGTFHC